MPSLSGRWAIGTGTGPVRLHPSSEESLTKIAFLGYGKVGAPLADGLQRAGHHVRLAVNRERGSGAESALSRNPALKALPTAEALADAEVVILAVPFPAVAEVLSEWAESLDGKILVDATNPVGPGLSHGLNSIRSGSETIAALVAGAHVVKTFSVYGYENLEDNRFPDSSVTPMMPLAGDEEAAKSAVGELVADLGREPLDVGEDVPLAPALERMERRLVIPIQLLEHLEGSRRIRRRVHSRGHERGGLRVLPTIRLGVLD